MADTSARRRFLQCPRCGAENLPTSKFCANCGFNLRGDKEAPVAASLPSRSGTLLPYSPGQSGPGPVARLSLIGIALILVVCLALACLYLNSGADRAAPRGTPVITPRR